MGKLRRYLYGAKGINIFTNHPPLAYSVSEKKKKNNSKIKRWKAFIDEHNANVFYKPGKENHVAEALSRQDLNALESQSTKSDVATVHSEASIKSTYKPLNYFRNQIIIEEAKFPLTRRFATLKTKMRHPISFTNKKALFNVLKKVVSPDVVNALHCSLHVLAQIQNELVIAFPTTKFRHCKNLVADIFSLDEMLKITTVEHNRAYKKA